MKPTLEQIKTDETVWPERATHYKGGLFYKNEDGAWIECFDDSLSQNDPEWFKDAILRPAKSFVPEVGEFSSEGHHEGFKECKFFGVASCGGLIIEYLPENNESRTNVALFDPNLTTFRPIKSERELFQESVKAKIPNADTEDIIFAGKLFDAGCRFKETE